MSNKINIWVGGSVVRKDPDIYNPTTYYEELPINNTSRLVTGGIYTGGADVAPINTGPNIINNDNNNDDDNSFCWDLSYPTWDESLPIWS